MVTDEEWIYIRQKAYPQKAVNAPPFLWTRILARIEGEEKRRASLWWMQWRWMGRLAIAASLLVGLGTYILLQHAALSLDAALEGRSNQQHAIQIATADMPTSDDSAVL